MSIIPESHTFTIQYDQPVKMIQCKVGVSQESLSDSPVESDFSFHTYTALWDTGATNTVITARIFKQLKLQQIGIAIVATAAGEIDSPVCYLALKLPNGLSFPFLQATVCENMLGDADVLIGMDIIGYGDFAFSFGTCKPVMTYRAPAGLHVNYRRNPIVYGNIANAKPIPVVSPSELCPCKSGFTYEDCHGAIPTVSIVPPIALRPLI